MQTKNTTTNHQLTGREPFDFDPAFYSYVMGQAAVRLEGKEDNKVRPYIGLKSALGGAGFIVRPVLSSSPTGWALTGDVEVVIQVTARNSMGRLQDFKMKYSLSADGSAKARTVYTKNPSLNANSKEALLAFINLIASDPHRFIPLLNADHCGMCGKYLKVPESRGAGIGPECIKLFRITVELAGEKLDDVIDDVKELRRQMQQAHPDHGGDVDVFIALRKEFDRIKGVAK